MVVIQLNMKWLFLMEPQLRAGIFPKLTAVCEHFRGYYAIEYYHPFVCQDCQDLCHDFLQAPSMTSNEDGIWTGKHGYIFL